ncbi:MAG TPA: hypothetical protein DCY20_11280 [Firmicutes bacterium]|nr:hypothetical protein [Bacillota bacterium]
MLDYRTELYYKLDFPNAKKVAKSKESLEEKVRNQEKTNIAKKLLDVLDDEMISTKVGLTLEEVQALR